MLAGCGSSITGRDLSGRRWDKNSISQKARNPSVVEIHRRKARNPSLEALNQWPHGSGVLKLADLPPEPSNSRRLEVHLVEVEFRRAERDHLQSHAEMATWSEVPKQAATTKILNCK